MLADEASACSVPVFRYALGQWKPSDYSACVYHRAQLTAAQKVSPTRLEEPATPVNLRVRLVDLDARPDADAMKLSQRHGKGATLPHLLIQYPEAEDESPLAFTGPLEGGSLARLLDSPA